MNILKSTMTAMEIDPCEYRMEKFTAYRDLVLEWNQKINLTAINDPIEFEIKHFADSLLASGYVGFRNSIEIIDVGTGAGFPGIPLAICFPEKQFVLLDSLNKRIKVLNDIIAVLGLKNAKAVHGRAEDLAAEQFHREKYDICLSRAVAELPILAEYCLPFVRVGGYFGAYKTTDFHEELNKSKKALKILGGRFKDTTEFPIDLGMDHNIIWIEKTGKTPAKFPRRAGIPSKEPII